MSIRDDILAVMQATGKPLRSREIALAISEWRGEPITVQSVASHLGYLAKDGAVIKRKVNAGEPLKQWRFQSRHEASHYVWLIPNTMARATFMEMCHNARVRKTFPRAVIPRVVALPVRIIGPTGGPRPRTDDMRVMFEDIERADPTIQLKADRLEDEMICASGAALKIMKNSKYGRSLL